MTREKSPSLEVVSSTPETAESGSERRRLPRLNLGAEQFRLQSNGKIFAVTDLSTEGMAFRVLEPDDLVLFTVGAEFAGRLNLRGIKFAFRARVRHVRRDLVGCQFVELGPGMSEALGRLLEPEELGRALQPAPPLEGGALFYHGPSGTELVLFRSLDGQFQKFVIHLLGSMIQWERTAGLQTGRVHASGERSENRGSFRYETMLLDADPTPDPEKLAIAKRLLLSSNLPESLVKWAVRQLSFS